MKTSLGLLEVSGLALAISAADAMAKSASINLIGIEKTNGSGWMLIRLTGDVASVQAAINTGAAFAELHHGLVSRAVLARPTKALLAYWLTEAVEVAAPEIAVAIELVVATAPINEETEATEPQPVAATATDDVPEPVFSAEKISAEESSVESEALIAPRVSCNLCLDPACRRHKGEPRFRCIHLGKRGKV
ncbi:BMC domain-containing protein [Yersinia intermedia]|uniref:BMC domain-containing protein n=1 Tax=Yersinia intermedia TaxID=631 RepID=UPI001CFDD44D|nr:BMC domain-containing protein [Yersinia intermedia]MCB5311196.1 BMC domain-containing protein [Yersinia intermedia]MCB5325914.1 BMC domain-containing protein [Yersinia intermedia]